MGGGCGGVSHFFLLISRLQDTGGEWGGGGAVGPGEWTGKQQKKGGWRGKEAVGKQLMVVYNNIFIQILLLI